MTRTKTHQLDDDIDCLLLVSDLHANLPALEAFNDVRQSIAGKSRIVYNGDVFSGGARPVEAATWVIEEAGELATLGNHDDKMLAADELDGDAAIPPPYTEAGASARLSREQRQHFNALPHRLQLSWRGKAIVLMHGHLHINGAPCHWMLTPKEQAAQFRDNSLGDSHVDLFVLGHTHYPYMVELGDVVYANPGSMGATVLGVQDGERYHCQSGIADDDLRSSFLSLTEERGVLTVHLTRFDYDRQAALDDLERADAPDIEFRRRWLTEGLVVL